mmetsp:Transcript_15711/g.17922  ORF Transcript_15711/g.17922 Transcript_15711/m.17922 type:complete len:263 (+) Transcript_15711:178-966(+)
MLISLLLSSLFCFTTFKKTYSFSTFKNYHSTQRTIIKSSDYNKNDDGLNLSVVFDDSDAQSQFGTKIYWDEMYQGMGDFSSEEYSWYYGFESIKPYFIEYAPQPSKKKTSEKDEPRILVPGIGNDGILLDLYNFGYKDITAFDYSESAVERQLELVSYDSKATEDIKVLVRDARKLDKEWENSFDIIFEKGALDAIYLSGDGYVNMAIKELTRVLKKDGYFISVSGVIPEDLRKEIFQTDCWEWLRDGSNDLKAGCFVWRKL